MNILYGVYTLLTSSLLISCLPPFWLYTRISGRHGENLKERLGCVPRGTGRRLTGSPRIWIHAVSLGEVRVADCIIRALEHMLPGCSILVSTTTAHGRKLARESFGGDIPVVYAPVDFIGSVRKAILRVNPHVLVFLETEIWPAWLTEARRMGIKTALVNGRISTRSIGSYLRFRPFFRQVLKKVDAFSMIREDDGSRLVALGADPSKISINGNAKYDLLKSIADPGLEGEMRSLLSLGDLDPVIVAGSTREKEEALVLDAYQIILEEFPNAILIVAPRHIERSGEIASLLRGRGYRYQFRSELDGSGTRRVEQIVIVDTFGELFKLYSVGTIVFCGASLVALGGQNPMEAAVWGKPVFYGPSMEDFLDAKALLEKVGAGVTVASPQMFAEKAIWFLRHPDALKTYGARAYEAVVTHHNASERHARVITGLV